MGRGKMSAVGAVDLANTFVEECPIPPGALRAFATLGCNNTYPSNCERDLFRFIKSLFGFKLEPYTVEMTLQDPWRVN